MEKLTTDERFVLYVMKTRKPMELHHSRFKQAISKIAKDVAMDIEELREILVSLKGKGYLKTEINRDRSVKWIVK